MSHPEQIIEGPIEHLYIRAQSLPDDLRPKYIADVKSSAMLYGRWKPTGLYGFTGTYSMPTAEFEALRVKWAGHFPPKPKPPPPPPGGEVRAVAAEPVEPQGKFPEPPPTINKGVGTNLHRLLATQLGVKPTGKCGCQHFINLMDWWGPDECERQMDRNVTHLLSQTHQLAKNAQGLWAKAKAHVIQAAAAVAPEQMQRDYLAGLVREAIERTRSVAAPRHADAAAEALSRM